LRINELWVLAAESSSACVALAAGPGSPRSGAGNNWGLVLGSHVACQERLVQRRRETVPEASGKAALNVSFREPKQQVKRQHDYHHSTERTDIQDTKKTSYIECRAAIDNCLQLTMEVPFTFMI
ncbi:hypothetical protein XENORESO_000807, partial [Xenotaenia resolanae]